MIDRATEMAYEIAREAEFILNSEADPIPDLIDFVREKAGQDNITYAIVIDTNVQAVAHSDPNKQDKTYPCIFRYFQHRKYHYGNCKSD